MACYLTLSINQAPVVNMEDGQATESATNMGDAQKISLGVGEAKSARIALALSVSGSRDGCFALWDLKCKRSSLREEFCINSTGMVKGAHPFPLSKVIGRCKAASSSITSVLYLKDEITIATAGAPDRYFHNAD
ncbi:hypothetical protein Bca52824_078145 [Brassica carinata]|uniref:Uncharacterized protein n=1 Tax=Brassica carinata TaxID=52824 RepID=A0A8X7PV85_BRACI|nr:hypothetical protein Bca52824_078145 [Brassica carinata]